MCGICGVVQVTGRPRPVLDEGVLLAMTDVMTHRGPDDRGLHLADGIALGARRLSIVDVEGGHQPVSNERGDVWAVQNGELYNHLALREELATAGHRFGNRCDTEILPHLYEESSASFPGRLRGMFGVAVWDATTRTAVLARDRLGIKPLYWASRGDLVVFASELKSLLASGLVEPELDYEAIDSYLTFGFVPGPRTPLAGISKLMPGHVLVVADGRIRTEPYWRFPRPHVGTRQTPEDYRRQLIEKLDESVELRLMSDVPLGAMLSGGLDSSVIVALMARRMREPVKTFSVGFAEAGSENELAVARRVAEHFGTDHHELELSFARDSVSLEELVWHLDEPLADLSSLGFLALSELATRHVTVALSGQGADELFGGYARHRAAAAATTWYRVPGPIRTAAVSGARLGPRRLRRMLRSVDAGGTVDRFLAMARGNRVDDDLMRRLRTGPLSTARGTARTVLAERLGDLVASPLEESLYVDAQLGLVDDMLHYFDRASMARSLEVRVPFLDHELVELVATIPAQLKVHRLDTKHILRESARGIVPGWVIDRPKVGFFHGAVGGWITGHARRAVDDYLLRPDARSSDFLEPAAVRELVTRSHAGAAAETQLLIAILVLEIWLSTYLPRATSVAPAARCASA